MNSYREKFIVDEYIYNEWIKEISNRINRDEHIHIGYPLKNSNYTILIVLDETTMKTCRVKTLSCYKTPAFCTCYARLKGLPVCRLVTPQTVDTVKPEKGFIVREISYKPLDEYHFAFKIIKGKFKRISPKEANAFIEKFKSMPEKDENGYFLPTYNFYSEAMSIYDL